MKVLHGTSPARTNENDDTPAPARRNRAKDNLLAPLGALFLGGVVAFGKPRDAYADGPNLPGPVPTGAVTAPLDVDVRPGLFADAKQAKPRLKAEIERLENSERFQALDPELIADVLTRHGSADARTRSFLRGLVSSTTFATMSGEEQRALVNIAAGDDTAAKALYQSTISSASYKALETGPRQDRLRLLIELAPAAGADLLAVLEDPEYAALPADVRAETVDALDRTPADNRRWVIGLVNSETYQHVDADRRSALVDAVGDAEPGFITAYRAEIGTKAYQASPSADRAVRLTNLLDVRDRLAALPIDGASSVLRLPHGAREVVANALETNPQETASIVAGLSHRTPVLSMMPGANATERAENAVAFASSLSGSPEVRAAKTARLLGLMPGEGRADQLAGIAKLWTNLPGASFGEKLEKLHDLVPMLRSENVSVGALGRMQSGYAELSKLAGEVPQPMVKEMDMVVDFAPRHIDPEQISQFRHVVNAVQGILAPPPLRVEKVTNHTVQTPGGPMPVRVIRPFGPAGDRPVIQFNHGGAYLVGDIESYDSVCRRLAALTGCTVVIPDYRLAPEHTYPAAVDDGMACYEWICDNAETLGVDPSRIVLAGDSAGGNLTAAMTHRLKDGELPEPVQQVLIYPWLDLEGEMPSRRTLGRRNLIKTPAMREAGRLYAPEREDRRTADVSPLRAGDFEGLPPALVMLGAHDPLHDEGVAYTDALAMSGVPTDFAEYPTMTHGFLSMSDLVDMQRDPYARLAKSIRSAVGETAALPRPVVDHTRARQLDHQVFDIVVGEVTKDWAPHEKRALNNIISLLDELAGADEMINYGDKSAIINSLMRDTPGLIAGAHEGIDMMVHRPMINRIAHNAVNRAFRPTWRPFAARRRARIRGRVYSEARSLASRMINDLFSQLQIDPSTAYRPDPDRSRNITIARIRGLENDIKVLQQKFGVEGAGNMEGELKEILTGAGIFDRPLFHDGIPSPRRLSFFVTALDQAL